MSRPREPVTRASWKGELSFPQTSSALSYDDTFSKSEFSRLALGYFPKDMDDRWFVYFENDTLYLHRSWTGDCMYRLRFATTPEGWCVREARVAGDPASRKGSSSEFEVGLLRWLLRAVLLGQDVPYPKRPPWSMPAFR